MKMGKCCKNQLRGLKVVASKEQKSVMKGHEKQVSAAFLYNPDTST